MWEFPDAWLLLSIGLARKSSVESVIASADYINVGIPSCEEFQVSVGRLVAAGLVEADADQLRLTPAGDGLVRKCRVAGEGIRLVPSRIEQELATEVPFPEGSPAWPLSAADWRAAFDRYWESMQ